MEVETKPTVIHRKGQNVPDISILCTTYNNERYIEQTVESFLNQTTSYPYEIVIHDDASTDDTPELLKRLYRKHPTQITLVLQNENQYSKGHFLPMLYLSRYASGEVFMLCEGDDYWNSTQKIALQYTAYLEQKNVELIFHPTYEEFDNGEKRLNCQHYQHRHLFSANDVILGTGGFCPTPSILVSKRAFLSLPSELIDVMPCGDIFIQIYGSLLGGALFLPEPLCTYRMHSDYSVTAALDKASTYKRIDFYHAVATSYAIARKSLRLKHAFALTKMQQKYKRKAKKAKRKAAARNLV